MSTHMVTDLMRSPSRRSPLEYGMSGCVLLRGIQTFDAPNARSEWSRQFIQPFSFATGPNGLLQQAATSRTWGPLHKEMYEIAVAVSTGMSRR